jgi:hypothetical protein
LLVRVRAVLIIITAHSATSFATHTISSLWKSLRMAGLDPERARFAVTDTIQKIGGTKPKTFEQFVRDQQQELAPQPAAASA